MNLNFRRGIRRRKGSGLTYRLADQPFALYCCDQVEGIPQNPVRWLVIQRLETGERILYRGRSRQAAEKALRRELRKNAGNQPGPRLAKITASR